MAVIQNEKHVDWIDGRAVINMQRIKSIEYYMRIDEMWIYWDDGEIEKIPGQMHVGGRPVGRVVAK